MAMNPCLQHPAQNMEQAKLVQRHHLAKAVLACDALVHPATVVAIVRLQSPHTMMHTARLRLQSLPATAVAISSNDYLPVLALALNLALALASFAFSSLATSRRVVVLAFVLGMGNQWHDQFFGIG